MGVKGLYKYIEDFCPDAISYISIGKEAEEFRRRNNKIPLIVVDGLALLRKLYGRLDWICGGQWCELADKLLEFVKKFQKAGIQLVFIFDGSVGNTKRKVWIQRRKRNRKEVANVFEKVHRTKKIPRGHLLVLPPNISMQIKYGLKHITNALVYQSMGEADHEIWEFVIKNDCWGVLTQDTDFIMFNNCGIWFSEENLNVNKMRSTAVDQKKLCQHLGLMPLHMPILATLIGNDIVPFSKLGYFHTRICSSNKSGKSYNHVIPAVSDFIRKNFDTKHFFQSVRSIAEMVFEGHDNRTLVLESVQEFLSSRDLMLIEKQEMTTALQTLSVSPKASEDGKGKSHPGLREPDSKGKRHAGKKSYPQEEKSVVADTSVAEKGAIANKPPGERSPSSDQLEKSQSGEMLEGATGWSNPVMSPKREIHTSQQTPNRAFLSVHNFSVVATKIDPEVLHVAEQKHICAENMSFVFNVMRGVELDSGVSMQDDNNNEVPSTAIIYTPIKQRVYGLLLGVGVINQTGRHYNDCVSPDI